MDPLTLALIMGGVGAGTGLLKSSQANKQRNEDLRLAANTAKYSPWTGMKPGEIGKVSDPLMESLSGAAPGALSGFQFGQNMQAGDAANARSKAEKDYLEALAASTRGNGGSSSAVSPGYLGVDTRMLK